MAPKLSGHFTVITYDLRGHGASPLTDGAFGLDELVADLERLRERTGFAQAHFAGHSLGGMIGPAYARRYPERVRSLGLLSTAAGRSDEDSAKVWGVVRAMEERGIAQVLGTLTDRMPTRARRLHQQRGEALHPPKQRDVIDLDPALGQQFFEVAV